MVRRVVPLSVLTSALVFVGAVATRAIWLPTNWSLTPPSGPVSTTGTFPQGLALSADGTKIAVLESGVNPPALRILDARDLQTLRVIPLKDDFGTPVWSDATHVIIPGASTDSVETVDLASGDVDTQHAGKYISAVARAADGTIYAVSDLGNTFVRMGSSLTATPTGAHPAAIAIAGDSFYVANRGEATLTHILSDKEESIAVDLHPAALALSNDGSVLYVACSDADTIDVVDTKTDRVIDRIEVGLPQGHGASPNALAVAANGTLYASLGAENAIAEIRGDRVIARAPAGWYPTGVAVDASTVYVSNGRGEGSHANPGFNPERRHDPEYVGSGMTGSVRAIARDSFGPASTADVLADIPVPVPTPAQTVVRADGPIKHVIYIIKENRTYDQVLGDLPQGDGDPKLAWFGQKITPNEHALAMRFGIYDRTFTDAQVSATGHNWSTAAFANDYVERFWPPNYGGRRELYDFQQPGMVSGPGTGYLWDDADRHGISLRDYGEYVDDPARPGGDYTTGMRGLEGRIDPHYPTWNLDISDEVRVDAWKREFEGYVRSGNLPTLEIMWLPNDHTYGTRPGKLTPQSYAAQNDHALGRVVDAVSHSRYWASTAIFAIEDDSQNGPDHVDDQRTTFYLISPYAAPGVHHAHYSTSSVLRTIELLLGLPPMTIYDAVAPPMYDGFDLQPDLRPYDVIAEKIDDTITNQRHAYGAGLSARMNFSVPDAADARTLNRILAHNAASWRAKQPRASLP
ncbi:MAG TPA: hypothetical protein VMF11_15585 [Candidatus Baltobacteraceae bacterium]|nr:hypothetical protein [Candidatus Baltobacteraceae bacterium]